MDMGLKAIIPLHGHIWPIIISGDSDAWKKAQKNDKKKKTSDVINKIIPNFNPLITSAVCIFSIVDSRITSIHHLNEINIIKIIFTQIINCSLFVRKVLALENTRLKTWKDAKMGQGLGVTKWYGIVIKWISNFKINLFRSLRLLV